MTEGVDGDPPGWAAVVALRSLRNGKSRLNLPLPSRRVLIRAMAEDTVDAVSRCPDVGMVVVVTADPTVERSFGRRDVPILLQTESSGLNGAFSVAARWVASNRPTAHLALLPADIPRLVPRELSLAFTRATGHVNVIADAEGHGTVMLAVRAGQEARPAFGPKSLNAHLRGGAQLISGDELDGLRHDVDTLDDLRTAFALGCGTNTRAAVRKLNMSVRDQIAS